MYGKIFDSIYDGTLAEDWRALITFQQMIVLCDADGVIDMTAHAISRRTGIPIEHIEAGIKVLENPDPYSRTPGDDGRRIMRIDAHRPWGWYIVNHNKYKNLQDSDTVRAQTRERVRKHRESQKTTVKTVTDCNACNADVTDGNGQKRYTDTNTDTDTNKDQNTSPEPFQDSGQLLPTEPPEPAVIDIPLVDKTTHGITQAQIDDWSKSFPAVDVLQTLRTIREWNLSNPARQKTKRGIRKHITDWLAKDQNRGGIQQRVTAPPNMPQAVQNKSHVPEWRGHKQ